ncbi:TPA: MerR family transcriptional regulator [Escherichia coli]|nr:MerR family transcriptional regulator [Escherichia coli]
MYDKKLLTLAEIAKQLDIPESTARFYRDRFPKYIPAVGEGRQKRYRPETVDVLRFIADGFKRNVTAIELEEELTRIFARNVDDPKATAMTAAAPQQQHNGQEFSMIAEMFRHGMVEVAAAMQTIAEQRHEINELRQQIAAIPQPKSREQERADQIAAKLAERKVEAQLRKEALAAWNELPQSERMRSAGWFRKQEDADKREQFVRDYIDERFAAALRKEYGFVDGTAEV